MNRGRVLNVVWGLATVTDLLVLVGLVAAALWTAFPGSGAAAIPPALLGGFVLWYALLATCWRLLLRKPLLRELDVPYMEVF